jgi:PAS domain S-box-containing protein
MEAATDGVVSADSAGIIVYVNPATEKLFGYSARELLGQPLSRLVPERYHETYLDELAEYAGTRGNQGIGRTVEIVGKRKDGSEFPVDLSLGSWSTGGETFFAGIVRDIAERKKVEAQLLVADRMVSVGTLAAGVAHEINNPLAAVIGNLDMSVRDVSALAARIGEPANVGELQEQLNDAREAAERVRSIVRDLKIFSRGEQERRGPVDVVQVLESTLRMAWNEIRHRARLVKRYEKVPPVEASESRLGQVFLNIVVNAAQAMEDGQADKNEIRVGTRVNAAGSVVIEIGDTGPGIPPQVMQRLFTPFLTTKPVGMGTGLGLSICHRIVTELGGEISVTSESGAGTVFQVTLPRARTAVEAPAAPAPVDAKPVRRGRILVVDDDPAIAKVVARTLAPQHEVVAVDRARRALELITAGERFDVVLCDLMMPEVTGADFHDELLRIAPDHASGIIFLTGGAFTPRARDFLNAVPNQRVEKPFDTRALQALINERMR